MAINNTNTQGKVARARQVIRELCEGRREWLMSIPARPDYDPDLVITDALNALEADKKALLESIRKHRDADVDETDFHLADEELYKEAGI